MVQDIVITLSVLMLLASILYRGDAQSNCDETSAECTCYPPCHPYLYQTIVNGACIKICSCQCLSPPPPSQINPLQPPPPPPMTKPNPHPQPSPPPPPMTKSNMQPPQPPVVPKSNSSTEAPPITAIVSPIPSTPLNQCESLKERSTQLPMDADDENAPLYQTLEYYMGEPLPPPENYPNELFEVTRNSLELLSSILSTGTEPKPPKDDLTESMLEKCKQSQLAIQMIIESTTDDDGTLFEALNLNDELQQVISKFEVLETGSKVDTTAVIPTAHAETDIESTLDASPSNHNETKTIASPSTHNETQMNASRKAGGIEPGSDAKVSNENEESERV
ncbi:pollen-specific leucine-rich repeat extensin-like protein 2 [Hibiscus syriacus]|uniref:pollen-specific leucine-rich repeat extensin-like protein 2 n=1 Tax=Hibiscus syriacus TaxID=106335 RepID=UPI001924E776|nr:pollen-specific leucine-rich repeat extensin-like protein 2 [Hibiscus syriacus]